MAYTLCKINIKELKKDITAGFREFDLVDGQIPIQVYKFDGDENPAYYTQLPDETDPATNDWSFFYKEKKLKMHISTDEDIYIVYSLLVSNDNNYRAPLDPKGTGRRYKWEPYLDREIKVTESNKNILEGIISYNSLSVGLNVSDKDGLRYLFGSNYSVMNLDFRVWVEDNDGSITKIYTGVGSGVSTFETKVTYEAKPKTKLLDEPAYFGFLGSNLFKGYDSQGVFQYTDNPYFGEDKDSIPIICASILPYTVKQINYDIPDSGRYVLSSSLWQYGQVTIAPTDLSVKAFEPSSLLPMKGDMEGVDNFSAKLKLFPGIFFTDFDEDDYTPAEMSDRIFECYTISDLACRGTEEYLAPFFMSRNPRIEAYVPQGGMFASIDYPLPCDWGYVNNEKNRTLIVKNYYNSQFSGEPYPSTAYKFLGRPMGGNFGSNGSYFTPKNRFKVLFTNNEKLNDYIDSYDYKSISTSSDSSPGKLSEITTQQSKQSPRLIPYDILTPTNWKATELWRNAATYDSGARFLELKAYPGFGNDDNTDDTLASFYRDIYNVDAGKVAFEFYLQFQRPVGHPSLSMRNFLRVTLKAAFGVEPDLTELDFDESMQMIEYTNQTYRDLLEKILPSIGCFISYDQESEVPKLIKIDPTKAPVVNINESEFWGLQTRTNTQDTYRQVNFKNETMFMGDNTRDRFLNETYVTSNNPPNVGDIAYDTTYTANTTKGGVTIGNGLNTTEKIKKINLMTMAASRAREISGWHIDNKFIHKFNVANIEKFKNVKMGDVIELKTDQCIDASGRYNILITQRSKDESVISFEGIKFASI